MINITLEDNMEMMSKIKDKEFDLAIVDPPYASKNIQGGYTSGIGSSKGAAKQKGYDMAVFDNKKPTEKYFEELIRVSKNQIIWGANHFSLCQLELSSGWVVWDKKNENTGYSDCEIAYTSFQKALRKFEFRWNGMLQGDMKNKEIRIHPTQKPVRLYEWLLDSYAKKGDKILDTHLGSGSIAIACHNRGFELRACEIEPEYFYQAKMRLQEHQKQLRIF